MTDHDNEKIFRRLSKVFARTRLEANNKTKFRARYRFTKDLASVNKDALTFLAEQFPHCSMAVVRNALGAFDSHLLPAYAALFAVEHEISHDDFGGWVPGATMRVLNKRPRKTAPFDVNDDRWSAIQRQELLQIQQQLNMGASAQDSNKIFEEPVREFKCPICFDFYPADLVVQCQPKHDMPGTSTVHFFCYNCIRGVAKEAADGAGRVDVLGIPYEIRTLLPDLLRRRLSDIIQSENLRATGIQVESCKVCGFSGIPETLKEDDPVFRCPNCGGQHCRLCGEKWTEEHQGRSCDELKGSALRQYQQRLTDAVVRVCKHCGLSYEKKDGCNRIICRCGATYCYLCRTENVTYDHFCKHTTEASLNKCRMCNKSCRLWATPTKFIRKEVAKIKEEALNDPRIAEFVSPIEKSFTDPIWER
uniref:RING-type domain-containing protein n=1 Tax=Syphacia muris TaxID=451379 RepID=A0A158R698_9BILA